jgi:hypothetical protein
MSSDRAAAAGEATPALTIEFDADAPALNPSAAAVLLRVLMSSDKLVDGDEGAIEPTAGASPRL